VATVPEVVGRLLKTGVETTVQAGAGSASGFSDDSYTQSGASVAADGVSAVSGAEVIARVQAPTPEEVGSLPIGSILVSFLQPGTQPEIVEALTARKVTAFSLDLLPRISRAQSMDALSSQATVSGYRAALDGAELLPKFFPMFMTAAGTVPPAKVLVLGAGVAGLQAIATARRLGAQVRAHDVRAAAKEEVMSLGATFVELGLEAQEGTGGYAREQSAEFLSRQRELIGNEVAAADVVITTAAVPGRKAPVLVTAEMVDGMKPGAVVIDLAADQGGNCELSQAGVDLDHKGVVIRGMTNPPSSMPTHASFLYARNVANFIGLLVKDGKLEPDMTDEILATSCVTHEGAVVSTQPPNLPVAGQPQPVTGQPAPAPDPLAPAGSVGHEVPAESEELEK
jgi:proton-translocating NAD(P)+ transhydrogenase subunit alpha